MKLTYKCLTKALDLRSVSARFIKGAIWANARAKWKMDVKVANGLTVPRFGPVHTIVIRCVITLK